MRRVDEVQVNSVGSTCGRGYQNMPMLRPPECIFYLCIVVSLHDNPACIMLPAESEKRTYLLIISSRSGNFRKPLTFGSIWIVRSCSSSLVGLMPNTL